MSSLLDDFLEIEPELQRTQKYRRNVVGVDQPEPDKKTKFLHPRNIQYIRGRIYARHIKTGGHDKSPVIVDAIMKEIPIWLKEQNLDGYESLVHYDVDSEMEAINNAFIRDFQLKHKGLFKNEERNTITATHKFDMYDYRNFDAYKGDRFFVNSGKDSVYRYNNSIPVYQWCNNTRNYDRDNTEGLRNRGSVNTIDRGFRHDRILDIVNGDYDQIDNLDKPYYGVHRTDQYPYSIP